MFPQTGEWTEGEAAFPAAIKALDQINQRVDILSGYYLNLFPYDTRVNHRWWHGHRNSFSLVFTWIGNDDSLRIALQQDFWHYQ